MDKLTWQEFEKIMSDANKANKLVEGVIVFKPESFDREFSEESRSYTVDSKAKYWNPMMGGASLFGDCLDGSEQGVRLDWYMKAIPEDNLGKRWIVDYCYLLESNQLNESLEEGETPVEVEFWETEEDRDRGEGSIYNYYKDTSESIQEAIEDARHVMHLMDYASIEVHDINKGKTYFWTDGVTEDFPDKIEESLITEDKDDNPVEIKFWRTTQDRELGLSGVYKSYPFNYESIQAAIDEAKKLRNTKRYASVEVFNNSTGNSYYWGDRKKEDYPLRGKKELDALLNGGEEDRSMTESTDKFYNYVKALLDAGAIDDPEYYNTLSDEEKEDLIRNTWMKDNEIIADYKALNESQVRDAANKINHDSRYNGDETQTLDGMLADKIAAIAEELGDDYSEWFGEEDIKYLIGTIKVSSVWNDFENELDKLIEDQVKDRVDWIRRDDPASRYYDSSDDYEELSESKSSNEFNHIDDVWEYLEQSKNEDDLEERIGDIPRKFGIFTYELINDGKTARVRNDYEEYDDMSYDEVDIDFLDYLDESKSDNNTEVNEDKKLEESSIGEYLGYTFIPVGNIKSTVNGYDVIESDSELDRLFNDESGYKYDDFYKALPEYDIFEIKELDYKRVVPIARGLFKFTGDRKTYNTISEIKSDEELSQIDNLGFIGDSDDKEIVSDLQNEDLSYSKISVKYGFAFNKYQLYNIATVYETADDDMKEKIEELLTDINYHSECAEIQEDAKKFKEDLFKEEKIEEDYTQVSNAGAIKIDILGQPSKKRSKKDKEDPVIKSLPAQQVLIEDKGTQRTLVRIYPDVGNSEEIYIDVPDTENRDEYIEKWLNANRENWNEYRILTESANTDKFKQLELAMANEVNRWLITRYDIDLTDNYATGPDDGATREDFEDYVYELLGDFSSALFLDYEDKNNLDLMWDCEIDPDSPHGIKVNVWEA